MTYAYARVSSRDQNLARQIKAFREYTPDLDDAAVFCDKQSGKDFNRENYQKLLSVVQPGDEVLVKELDRLGRNKEEIKEQIRWFQNRGVILRIFNVPTTLIDFKDQGLLADMINNILIEVLGAIAQNEREKIRQRQAEGIAAMPVVNGRKVSVKTGNPIGRPAIRLNDPSLRVLAEACRSGKRTARSCWEELGIGKTKWYELLKEVL